MELGRQKDRGEQSEAIALVYAWADTSLIPSGSTGGGEQ